MIVGIGEVSFKIWGGLLKKTGGGGLLVVIAEASTELQLESIVNLKIWGGLSTPKPDSNFAHDFRLCSMYR